MNNVLAHPAARIVAGVVALIVLVIAVWVVLTRAGEDDEAAYTPTPGIPEDATPEERTRAHLDTLPDGDHQGRLVTIDETTATFRLVRIMRGPEAVEAARADGVILEDATLPNELYVQDLRETRTLWILPDAAIQIQHCPNGCQEVATSLHGLLTGEAVPHGQLPVFVFTVSDGAVVAMNQLAVPS